MRVVHEAEHEPAIVQWMSSALRCQFSGPLIALGVTDDEGKIVGGVILNDFTGPNIEGSVYGPRAFRRSVMRYIFSYVFNKLKCDRITVRTRKKNRLVCRLAPRYGFVFEGIQKKYYGDDDAIVYRMLREECRWI